MVFSSVIFLFAFLPAVLFFYYILPKNLRNLVLLIFSLIFYAWGEPVYILLMLFSSTMNYTASLLIVKYRHKGNPSSEKAVLIISTVINLLLLGVFKYTGFLVNNINAILNLNLPYLDLPLPIGISFYTFQTMSYTIDVYRGDTQVQKNYISFAAYVTMFPQLIAGPIVRYQSIADQIDDRIESTDMFAAGIRTFTSGLAKKVLIANNIGMVWDRVREIPLGNLSVAASWIGIIAFAFQIYFDFSGYSDMAIGLGKMFGFEFPINFNYPYISKSITEFWRRWHISLGVWFREYVYIPLGGNRVKIAKHLRNLFIVWFLTGLWHGSSMNFIIWGLYYGLILAVEKYLLFNILDKLPNFIRHAYVLILVIIGWVIFSFEDLHYIFRYIGVMFGFGGGTLIDNLGIYLLYNNIIILVISAVASTPLPKNISAKRLPQMAIPVIVIAALIICCAYLVDASYNPFLYFRF